MGATLDFNITGTLIWYYNICQREVWLMVHHIVPDQNNENMTIGRAINENSYAREKKEIDLGNAKIDLIRTEKGQLVVGEVKKSSKYIESASQQLLFYLLQLREMGIDARGELLIPEEKKKIAINLDAESELLIKTVIEDVARICLMEKAPPAVRNKYCRNCAYTEFCWA